jgi:hypothetical protein
MAKKSGKGERKENVSKTKNAKTLKKDEGIKKEKTDRDKNLLNFLFISKKSGDT